MIECSSVISVLVGVLLCSLVFLIVFWSVVWMLFCYVVRVGVEVLGVGVRVVSWF